MSDERIREWSERIRQAAASGEPLCIRGGGTKDFYGGERRGAVLETRGHRGIVDYEPTELVITARAGTPLAEIESVMRAEGQMLGFEPPHFAPDPHGGSPGPAAAQRQGQGAATPEGAATLGGSIAAGLSGPRRPYAGAARDLVLGVRMLDGRGDDLRFGGRVMKNVAGYDISRLMVGALGTLGLLHEISLKALPLPAAEVTLRFELAEAEAIELMNVWAGRPFPVSATCHHEGVLYVRLSGSEAGVRAAGEKLGGEKMADGASFWREVREQTLACFTQGAPLWRVSLKATTPPLGLPGTQLIEWSGALRWIATDCGPEPVRSAAARGGGHATLFRAREKSAAVFHPLPPAASRLHERLKRAFDPAGIFNPGRLYPGW
jgi:glycolate oxidase FAD binding subunit